MQSLILIYIESSEKNAGLKCPSRFFDFHFDKKEDVQEQA
jgi:hypothetical protein